MRTISKFIKLSLVALLITACSSDDDASSVAITLNDFSVNVDEFSENGTVVGTVSATTNSGTITYALTNQLPSGALAINATTGELTVADATKFRFNDNETITATVTASVGSTNKSATVTIDLNRVSHFLINGNVYKMTQGFFEPTSSSLGSGYRVQLYSSSVNINNGVSGTGDLIYIRTQEQMNTTAYDVDEFATLLNNNFDVSDGITTQTATSGTLEVVSEQYSADFLTVDVEMNFSFTDGTDTISGYFNGTLVNND